MAIDGIIKEKQKAQTGAINIMTRCQMNKINLLNRIAFLTVLTVLLGCNPIGNVSVVESDVGTHGHFCGHPVVGTPIEIVLPRPSVFQGHQLIHINF